MKKSMNMHIKLTIAEASILILNLFINCVILY